jgi:hypothetical protein
MPARSFHLITKNPLSLSGFFMIRIIMREYKKENNLRDKNELLTLLTILRTEISELSRAHHEEAESIVRFAESSAYKATRCKESPACSLIREHKSLCRQYTWRFLK